MSSNQAPELWSKAKDILTIMVIPAFIWVISVSNTLEKTNVEMTVLKEAVEENKKNIVRLQDSERSFSIQLARLETRLDGITRKTDEIHNMLVRLSSTATNGGN
tara:strand:+ start:142 stop:453 length:312 start_codon:yes stop_codon:yes gene_type:complete